jgi:hypothetical protein
MPCGPIQQTHAEAVLERLNVLARRRRRHFKLARRGSEAAELHDFCKDGHGEKAVHMLLAIELAPIWRVRYDQGIEWGDTRLARACGALPPIAQFEKAPAAPTIIGRDPMTTRNSGMI